MPGGQRLDQIAEIAALEPPAQNHHHALVEALDRSARRLDVRRLRIVDESHAGNLGDRLERVLETRKTPRRLWS